MRIVLALATAAAAIAVALPAGAAPTCGGLIRGTSAADRISATASASRVLGMDGDDRITGTAGTDCLDGGAGRDRISGLAGADRLTGGAGPDLLIGGAGADRLTDAPQRYEHGAFDRAANRFQGGPGADVIDSANGRRDAVHCGAGRDRATADRFDRLIGCERRRFTASPLPEVRPAKGKRRTMFVVRFRALEAVASRGEFFSIRVRGPRAGCGSIATDSRGIRYRRNAVVRYRVKPFGPGGRSARQWCRGRYRGEVAFERTGSAAVRVGGFSFRVR